MTKDTGGYAYPRSVWKGSSDNYTDKETGGMTLWDYFMAHAPDAPEWFKPEMVVTKKEVGKTWDWKEKTYKKIKDALDSYDRHYAIEKIVQWKAHYADTMIAERSKE